MLIVITRPRIPLRDHVGDRRGQARRWRLLRRALFRRLGLLGRGFLLGGLLLPLLGGAVGILLLLPFLLVLDAVLRQHLDFLLQPTAKLVQVLSA